MKLDTQWLAKSAGWLAMKNGRSIVAAGGVLDFSKNEADFSFKGTFLFRGKKAVCSLKINSLTDISTHCFCPTSRATGALCEHGVAVLLCAISGEIPANSQGHASSKNHANRSTQSTQFKQVVPAVSCKIIFPESAQAWKRQTISARVVPVDEPPNRADGVFCQWLAAQLGGKIAQLPPILALSAQQMPEFLDNLKGHSRVFIGENLLEVSFESLEIECVAEEKNGLLFLKLNSESHASSPASKKIQFGSWILKNQRFAKIHSPANPLAVKILDELINHGSSCLNTEEFAAISEEFGTVARLVGSWIESFRKLPQSPDFQLIISGTTQCLLGRLIANYPTLKNASFELTKGEFSTQPIVHQQDGTWATRNFPAEKQALALLERTGFLPPEGISQNPSWELTDNELCLDFLTYSVPDWEKELGWKISFEGTIRSLANSLEPIRPVFRQTSGGQDWLEAQFSFETSSGEIFSSLEISKLLRKGSRKIKLPNGKIGLIDSARAALLENILAESNPQQTSGGNYRFDQLNSESIGKFFSLEPNAAQLERQKIANQSVEQILPTLQLVPRDYQKQGMTWLVEHLLSAGGALLADDMGLGKTFQAIAAILALGIAKNNATAKQAMPTAGGPFLPKTLIVCPTSLLENWRREWLAVAPEITTCILHGANRIRPQDSGAQVILTSYGVVARDFVAFRDWSPDVLVADEASFLRNPDTEIAKTLRKIPAPHRLALTGTPLENGLRDLWSLFEFILPGYLGPRKVFQQNYEKPAASEEIPAGLLARLEARVSPWILRRTKTEVAKDLPPKQISTVWCGLSNSQKTLYRQFLERGTAEIQETKKSRGPEAARMIMLTTLLRLRQVCCEPRLLPGANEARVAEISGKMERLLEMTKELAGNGHKILIFSQFAQMLRLIESELKEQKIPCVRIDGQTQNRAEIIHQFKSQPALPVFLISLKAGGYGLNLQEADTVILFDPWWNPAVENQAMDRAYRLGQTKAVQVFRLVSAGTVEEKILKLQSHKQNLSAAVLQSEDTPMMRALTESDLAELLE